MKALKIALKILFYIIISFALILILINAYFIVAQKFFKNDRATLFGFTYQVGLNYSMEPTLMPNDILITKAQGNYNLGDIVTFYAKDTNRITTHRIVEITQKGYITRGDSVTISSNDKEIENADIIGKVVFVIPNLGAVLRILNKPVGLLLLVAIVIVCGVLIRTLAEKD